MNERTVQRTVSILIAALLPSLVVGCNRKQTAPPEEAHKEVEGGGSEHGEGHTEIVRLSTDGARTAQIQTAEARRKPLSQGLSVPARITFPQTGVASVAARVPGRVSGIAVELGQNVKQGAILGYIESPELGKARADYLSAATKARVTENNYRREQTLTEKGISAEREAREAESAFVTAQADMNAGEARLHTLGLSDQEIRALKRDEHYSSRFPLRAPIDGTVVEIHVRVGQTVDSTTPLFTVGKLGELWAVLDVFEAQLPKLRVGQPVTIMLTAAPDKRFTGSIEYIGDVVEEKTRAIHVRVVVPNPGRALKPGMYATAEIATAGAGETPDAAAEPPRLIVPRDSVQKLGAEQVVFTPVGDNQFKAVKVRTGATSASEAEILSGIEPGTKVVTRGAFVLKSELSKESLGEGH